MSTRRKPGLTAEAALLTAVFLCVSAFLFPAATRAEQQQDAPPSSATALTAPSSPVSRTLNKNSKGDDVLLVQQTLQALGYSVGQLDGIYGSGTKEAVRQFQARNGLDADGIAGPQTLEKLFSEQAQTLAKTDVLAGEMPMLVNRDHAVAADFIPADMVDLSEYCDSKLVKIKYNGTQAVREAADALISMLKAAAADGVTNWQVSAAYRSFANQQSMMDYKTNTYLTNNPGWTRSKARSAASHTVADPGTSEHHTGLAFDMTVPGTSVFKGTKQCTWLHKHCWEHGFIIRYPEGKEKITKFTPEAWHIRYVGTRHSIPMRDGGLCLEEYLEQSGSGSGSPQNRSSGQ